MTKDHLTGQSADTQSLVVRNTFAQLQELADKARSYRARRLRETSEPNKRTAFVDLEITAAEARGFLECLSTLHLLTEDDEAAWYQYLAGERSTPPNSGARQ
jgi:hypothetical protein